MDADAFSPVIRISKFIENHFAAIGAFDQSFFFVDYFFHITDEFRTEPDFDTNILFFCILCLV